MSTGLAIGMASLVGLALVASRRIVTHEADPALRTRQLLLCWLRGRCWRWPFTDRQWPSVTRSWTTSGR